MSEKTHPENDGVDHGDDGTGRLRQDMSYTPSSEAETERLQHEDAGAQARRSADDEKAAEEVSVLPGTGGPDDQGAVELDDDLTMTERMRQAEERRTDG